MMQQKTYIVYKVIKYSDYFAKIIVIQNNKLEILILREDPNIRKIKPNDIIKVQGMYKIFKRQIEFEAHISKIEGSINPVDKFEIDDIEKLLIREQATLFIHKFFEKCELAPVQSPNIVSNWVEGKTVPFKVNYYNSDRYLSISNMIYHQLLLSKGMTAIYEFGVLHREELSSGKNKLSEYTTIDVSKLSCNIDEICNVFENLIVELREYLAQNNYYNIELIESVSFDTIDYKELLFNAGVSNFTGAQLPRECRDYLKRNYDSFVWIRNFDITKRPFYTKSENGITDDVQLWFKGDKYFAAGSGIENDYEKIIDNLKNRNRREGNYKYYLSQAKKGIPPMSMIAMGFEMLLSCLVKDSYTIDFSFFPRTKKIDFF